MPPKNPAQGKKKKHTGPTVFDMPSDLASLTDADLKLLGATTSTPASQETSTPLSAQNDVFQDVSEDFDINALPDLPPSESSSDDSDVIASVKEEVDWDDLVNQQERLDELAKTAESITPVTQELTELALEASPSIAKPRRVSVSSLLGHSIGQMDESSRPWFEALLQLETKHNEVQDGLLKQFHALEARLMVSENKLTLLTRENQALRVDNQKLLVKMDEDRAALNYRLDQIGVTKISAPVRNVVVPQPQPTAPAQPMTQRARRQAQVDFV